MKKLLWIVACCVLGTVSLSADQPASAAPPSSKAAATVSGPSPGGVAGTTDAGVVNLNEASADQLALLPGVGPSRANAIVAHRKAHPFKRLEELMRVKGFGKKTFARLRPLISVSGPTTLTERPSRSERPRRG
jgi:competence protein ComEA